ncbi:hypothetical protein [Nocardia sp. CA-145437]|uniref:hypothetical protein n=1 Tax=Nocardia sp. CA-145437 TaxID=3239980 RepID=UPI003D9568C4
MSSKNPWSVQAIIDRIEREKRQAADRAAEQTAVVGYAVRGLWSCYSDPGKLTAAQAHIAMQLHLGCGVGTCLVRRRARTALVSAGRMVLDARAERPSASPKRSLLTLLRVAAVAYSTLLFGGRRAVR